MTIVLFLLPAFLAALLAGALTPLTRAFAIRVGAVDYPGMRKIHHAAVPRLGGLAVLAAVAIILEATYLLSPAGAHLLPAELLQAVAIGVVPIVLISLIDDIRPLRATPKFIIHLAGAAVTVALGVRLGPVVHLFGGEVHIGWLAIPISIIWLAGTTNAFNLVDGLDGLSAGLALISAISLAAVSVVTMRPEMAAAALILAGALAGFLPFNLYPAKVYLGDTGSTAIGFFLGALTLRGGSTTSAGLAVILPVLVIGVPVAETLLSMARRLVRKLQGNGNILDADRDHIHHRLLALGYNHKRAVLMLYIVAVLLAVSAFVSLFLNEQNAALLLGALLIAAFVGVAKLGYDEFAIIRSGAVLRIYDRPVLSKSLFVVFADLALIVLAIYGAIVIKYDDWSVSSHRLLALNFLALAPIAALATFATMGIYRRAWSNANIEDLMRSSAAVILSSGATLILSRFIFGSSAPITFFLLYTIVALGLVNGSRASYRILYQWNRRSNRDGEPVVIYGAGKGGMLAVREILTNADIGMTPIGFIDDDPAKIGRIINGYPVLGDLDSLESVIVGGNAKGVVVASEKIPVSKVRNAQRVSESNGAWLTHFEVNFVRRGNNEERLAGGYRIVRGGWS